jgi:hypothetical protein
MHLFAADNFFLSFFAGSQKTEVEVSFLTEMTIFEMFSNFFSNTLLCFKKSFKDNDKNMVPTHSA